ncbi:N-acetylneuraminate synthase [Neptuniibacter pectenicola]|jgi:N-acetylneuraminate synthase|uniref:N-acetylneuraminate synthase n=1 Tax=Neptuniibacter pectenicola TaxID=1806669 RepID=A0ABU9TNF6_9GAMM
MTTIIAEAGVNHNGDKALAFALVDAAHEAGADIVKFQTFKAKNLVTSSAAQAEYQTRNTGKLESQFSMLSRLELSYETHRELIAYCRKLGIEFLSTAFDSESLHFLVDELGLSRLKIPSGELTNAPLVLEHAKTGCDLIVSTGMATLEEIEHALGVISFGYLGLESEPCEGLFIEAFRSKEGQALLKERVTLLHCTTDYPASLSDINLNAMDAMSGHFKLPVGYSDHSAGIVVSIAAAAKGALLIEKHFTLDCGMEGPDHKASLEPHQLKALVRAVRDVELALGDGCKVPRPSEIKNRNVARKSLVAAKDIEVGELFTSNNLEVKRPGSGMEPSKYWYMLGRKATKAFSEGEEIIE